MKLMGRDSGFVAMHAATAADVVDLCMIPEVKVDMKEGNDRLRLEGPWGATWDHGNDHGRCCDGFDDSKCYLRSWW